MTDDERKAILEKVADTLLLTLEQAVENFAQVMHGERRLALVPRKHPKIKTGEIYEFRLVTPPEPKPPAPQPRDLDAAELEALADEI